MEQTEELAAAAAAVRATPFEALYTREYQPMVRLAFLVDALACLAPRRRAAVILRFYADMPEAEIAAVLDVRVGTVKSMLHRSLRQLREVVER